MPVVTIIGAGVIGLSWAKLFAAAHWEVRVTDPRDDLRSLLDGIEAVAEPDLATALEGSDFVQENGPERIDVKRQIFSTAAQHTGGQTILASSTSSLLPSEISKDNPAADRILVGHPFNPPELMPLVEVVPSPSTSSEACERAVQVYRDLGRDPILLKHEIPGFVGNRLQKVLDNEAISLVQQGIIDPAGLDELVRTSLGLRWATVGPFEAAQLGGGPKGMRYLFEHVLSQMTFADGIVDPEKMDAVYDAVDEAFGSSAADYAKNAQKRDARTRAVLEALGDVP